MTREEEIKARLEKAQINAASYPVTRMDADLAYLLARNEELQRRVESAYFEGWSDGFDEGSFQCTDSSCPNEAKYYWDQSETCEFLISIYAADAEEK